MLRGGERELALAIQAGSGRVDGLIPIAAPGRAIQRAVKPCYDVTMAPRLVRKAATMPEATARIAVVADTHSHPHPATIARLAALAPDAILHAGDIGDLAVLDDLARIAPVFAIRGNIDTVARDLPDVLIVDHSGMASLRIAMVHIGVYGPRLRAEVATLARKERAHLVVCGHSHVPFIGTDRGITVFNPGSCGPRRFSLPIVFGMIEVTPSGLKLGHIDCETGSTWLPPLAA